MRGASRGIRNGERGAAYVEFLIAFMPVFTFFAGIVQYALMSTAQVFVDHAATVAARTAALALGRPGADENTGEQDTPVRLGAEREGLVRKAVVLTLAPLILDGTALEVNVDYPRTGYLGAADDPSQTFAAMTHTSTPYVRTRVQMKMACLIPVANRLMCGFGLAGGLLDPTKWLEAESVFPVERATYQPKPGCEPPLTGQAVASNAPPGGIPGGVPSPAIPGGPGTNDGWVCDTSGYCHPGSGQCFVAGTPVATPDGPRPIEQIEVGDRVLSRDPRTGLDSVQVVLQTFLRNSSNNVRVRMKADGSDEVAAVDSTRGHPYWKWPGVWTRAEDLENGDILLDSRGAFVRVVDTEPLPGEQPVYNMHVENTETYFAGGDLVWVHNTNQGQVNPNDPAAAQPALQDATLARWLVAHCFANSHSIVQGQATVAVAQFACTAPNGAVTTPTVIALNSGVMNDPTAMQCLQQFANAQNPPVILAPPQPFSQAAGRRVGRGGFHAEENLAYWHSQNLNCQGVSLGVNRPFCDPTKSGAHCQTYGGSQFQSWVTPINHAPFPAFYEGSVPGSFQEVFGQGLNPNGEPPPIGNGQMPAWFRPFQNGYVPGETPPTSPTESPISSPASSPPPSRPGTPVYGYPDNPNGGPATRGMSNQNGWGPPPAPGSCG